jgi:hypothetical protein
MNTFLPYSDFEKSAKCLDYRRLGKQRVEAYQLDIGLDNPDTFGWRNHPAFKMWIGYKYALVEYGITICYEWIERGYKDSLLPKFFDMLPDHTVTRYKDPPWLGNPEYHSSHRKALLYKDYDWYSKFGWSESPELNYVWPTNDNRRQNENPG